MADIILNRSGFKMKKEVCKICKAKFDTEEQLLEHLMDEKINDELREEGPDE